MSEPWQLIKIKLYVDNFLDLVERDDGNNCVIKENYPGQLNHAITNLSIARNHLDTLRLHSDG